jgi:hypothetical protein
MKSLLIAIAIIATALPHAALAQGKKKAAGMTCGQKCSAYCQNRHHNCFEVCSRRCR